MKAVAVVSLTFCLCILVLCVILAIQSANIYGYVFAIYAVLSFIAVVVLSKLLLKR